MEFYRTAEIVPPVVIMLTLLGVRGFSVGGERRWSRTRRPTIDRDVLFLPDALVEDLSQPVDAMMRPMFDALWQAAGVEQCMHYGQDGRWQMP